MSFEVRDGSLKVREPVGVLPLEALELMRERKPEILAHLAPEHGLSDALHDSDSPALKAGCALANQPWCADAKRENGGGRYDPSRAAGLSRRQRVHRQTDRMMLHIQGPRALDGDIRNSIRRHKQALVIDLLALQVAAEQAVEEAARILKAAAQAQNQEVPVTMNASKNDTTLLRDSLAALRGAIKKASVELEQAEAFRAGDPAGTATVLQAKRRARDRLSGLQQQAVAAEHQLRAAMQPHVEPLEATARGDADKRFTSSGPLRLPCPCPTLAPT